MILHISHMRRNVNRNVFNARKNVSATMYAAIFRPYKRGARAETMHDKSI